MSSFIGFFSLLISIGISFFLIILNLLAKLDLKKLNFLIRIGSTLTFISFFSLMYAYIISDFSNFNVFQNSHSSKPLIYKISGTWGNHEGSMLLWIAMLSIYSFIFSFTKKIDFELKKLSLSVQSSLHFLFGMFIILTSNPFLVNSVEVTEGLGLNPILQDPGLAIHPPLLYAGYLGYSLIFSIAIASLLQKNTTFEWIYIIKKWSLLSWSCLTGGIALGSYWAYYELGWGGWWFWDPVENISLMPWITGLALVHSIFLAKQEKVLQRWVIFLSILCFSLSVFGTFLVRSGILTSVHSFAADSSRGIFILLVFFLITGFGFTIFLFKSPENSKTINFLFINKISALLINNILMMIATLTILLGTIYPIIIEIITNTRISVGGPYFNSTVIPIMLPGFLLMSVAPILSWQSNRIKNGRYYIIGFISLSLVVLIHSFYSEFNTWGLIGIILGGWIITASIMAVILSYRINLSYNFIKIINPHIAHIGVGIAILGITCSSVFKTEYEYSLKKGDTFSINETTFKLDDIVTKKEINYQSLRANFLIKNNENIIGNIEAGKNYYPVSKIITTEAGIFHEFTKDIYFILGENKNDEWFIKVYVNPLVSFIWIGVIIMFFSGLIGISKK
tara:strand:- start:10349 stop:12214 length:1866 start_codon:yes stop_codon:yes gene_type:complete